MPRFSWRRPFVRNSFFLNNLFLLGVFLHLFDLNLTTVPRPRSAKKKPKVDESSIKDHEKMYKEIEDLVGRMKIHDPLISSSGSGNSSRRGSRNFEENFVILNKTKRRPAAESKCISSSRRLSEGISTMDYYVGEE